MIDSLPADVMLHILSFLPLPCLCQLLRTPPFAGCFPLIKQELMSRIKRDRWTLSFYHPSAYFAMLCNKEMIASTVPMATLTCKGYCSQSEYLRFETCYPPSSTTTFQLSDEDIQFETMSIYCSHWIKMFKEDDTIKLPWRQGSQTKEPHKGICIRYHCQLDNHQNCTVCDSKSRCQKHTFTNVMPTTTTKVFQITSVQVSLHWIRRGFS
ncbi:hypothetical protein FB192DRAFT_1384156 [Mucor lusitanicus]|uniref:F-box domain-containing protein n=2 Tax=Mucor circinelloides f. lusitanicus TaxID=29924 RepID=A0A168ITK4_MUCCL|nr:hypothetical protein FB192DRAFT_1384156 [Mucor lusitanicus]OAD00342.1 hypothetical protein MUCCIDRAFT_113811 [Mucor lusitanicus CBS 277.49]